MAVLLFLAGTEDIAVARQSTSVQRFTWHALSAESFAKAKREGKFILLDGAAEWCHWCHVMDETTYRDPEVGAWLQQNAIAIRVDIDERPDFAERYGAWGWPATVLLSADAEELGKFRGYLPPERMRAILDELKQQSALGPEAEPAPVGAAQLSRSIALAKKTLDARYDAKQGSWGTRKKVPIGMNLTWLLTEGSKTSFHRARFTLDHQRALIDPVWGGLFQYSGGDTWAQPHFEKLLRYQAANLEALATSYALTRDVHDRDDARALVHYVTTFLRSAEGTFFVTQDADLNAHDRSKPFVDGQTYYALDDAKRRALGVPRIDTHVYAAENGKMIAALALFPEARPLARTAADALATSHVLEDGTVKRETTSKGPYFLDDAASLGWGFLRLGDTARAKRIAERMLTRFADERSALLFDSTEDPDAVGVFARRGHGFAANVTAARLLAATGHVARAKEMFAALSAPERLDGEGAWLGDYLLAAHELGVGESAR